MRASERCKPFEVHEHSYVSGPRTGGGYGPDGKWQPGKFQHSHDRGNVRHQHPDTGPACYTIDKDEWARVTGLRGGGRKKFTAAPSGEQLPWKDLEDWQKSFQVIIGPPTPKKWGAGPGLAPAARMILGFGMTATVQGSAAPRGSAPRVKRQDSKRKTQ
jgi:hypothetical protein